MSANHPQSSERRCCISCVSSLMAIDIVRTGWNLKQNPAELRSTKGVEAEEYWPKCTEMLLLDRYVQNHLSAEIPMHVSKPDKRVLWSTVWKVTVRSKSTKTAERELTTLKAGH